MNDYVFALDIGTQSVTGIILKQRDSTYEVLDFCTEQHDERSMLDGQIHNVVAVSNVIKSVKEKLEETYGPLQDVFVAAAGRALKTIQTHIDKDIMTHPLTHNDEVRHLELSAIQHAQAKLVKRNKMNSFSNYHCVGYSVLHYKLDGEIIGSLIDQTGQIATVEVIATFLPKVVIESLISALDRANLTMGALTLEPIAAIHVLIPDSMRRLNVALIDIGAGTSDIAITNQGTVSAYGMVPVAGDKITEAVSDKYLLDFKIAEETKRKIVNEGEANVYDILGFETTITTHEFLPEITNHVKELAELLANEILNLNGEAPKAIMLIGGGSLTPGVGDALAQLLQLPINRVAIRGIQAIQQLHQCKTLPDGPDFVTPIGIAIAAKQNPIHYINVTVNENTIRMFELNKLTVGDCLIQAGIEIGSYYGRPGLASMVTINDESITLPGTYGQKPKILLNGVDASVEARVASDDEIIIKKGQDGREPHVTLEQLIDDIPTIYFYLNNKRAVLKPSYVVNDQPVTKEYIVQDKDKIIVHRPKTIKEYVQLENLHELIKPKDFYLYVDKEMINFNRAVEHVQVNMIQANLTDQIKQNDNIIIQKKHHITVETLLKRLNKQLTYTINITFNDKQISLSKQLLHVIRNGKELSLHDELNHLDTLKLKEKEASPFIFQDVFRYIELDNINTRGRYELYQNGNPVSFNDTLNPGDHLAIIWENK